MGIPSIRPILNDKIKTEMGGSQDWVIREVDGPTTDSIP
jgi:hypothetical protein